MNLNFRLEQFEIFISFFLIANLAFFLPLYYSLNIGTDRCDAIESGNQVDLEYEYREDLCQFVFVSWKDYILQKEELEPLLISFLFAFSAAGVFSYYKKAEIKYEEISLGSDDPS